MTPITMDAALIDVIKKVATLRFEFRAHKNNKNKITNTINMSAVLEPDLEIATNKKEEMQLKENDTYQDQYYR